MNSFFDQDDVDNNGEHGIDEIDLGEYQSSIMFNSSDSPNTTTNPTTTHPQFYQQQMNNEFYQQQNYYPQNQPQFVPQNVAAPSNNNNMNREDSLEKFDLDNASKVMNNKVKGPEEFDLLSILGIGGYGKVFLVKKRTEPNKDQLFAMKVLRKAFLMRSTKDITHTKCERGILERIKHPFIVELMYAFQTNAKLYLIMEYLQGGELFMQLEKKGRLPEPIATFYSAEILLALDHLHRNGIIYRDLKPENIMLTIEGHIKLTDFGLSKEHLDYNKKTDTFCGTIEYMAPEILMKDMYTFAADWWSFGAVLYDMLVGNPPFNESSRKRTIEMILRGKLLLPQNISLSGRDLLSKLMRRSPSMRLGYGMYGGKNVMEHPFFLGYDWDLLYNKQVQPPYKPSIKSLDDVSMFDERFTQMAAVDTPSDYAYAAVGGGAGYSQGGFFNNDSTDLFQGFSYVHPTLMGLDAVRNESVKYAQESHHAQYYHNHHYNHHQEQQQLNEQLAQQQILLKQSAFNFFNSNTNNNINFGANVDYGSKLYFDEGQNSNVGVNVNVGNVPEESIGGMNIPRAADTSSYAFYDEFMNKSYKPN